MLHSHRVLSDSDDEHGKNYELHLFPAVKGRGWIAHRDAQHPLLDRAMRHGALSQPIGVGSLAPGRVTNSGVQEASGSVCAESPLGSILTLTLFERSPLLSQSRPLSKFVHTQYIPNHHMLMTVSLRSAPKHLQHCPCIQEYLRSRYTATLQSVSATPIPPTRKIIWTGDIVSVVVGAGVSS